MNRLLSGLALCQVSTELSLVSRCWNVNLIGLEDRAGGYLSKKGKITWLESPQRANLCLSPTWKRCEIKAFGHLLGA